MKNEKISKYIFDETEKTDTLLFSKRKILFFKNIVTNSTLRIQKYKNMDIINASDLNRYTQILENTYKELENLLDIISNKGALSNNDIINKLQQINNDLSTIFKTYGTDNINDLITIALGTQFIKNNILSDSDKNIYEILKKYVHPISYKVLSKKEKSSNRIKVLTKTRIVEDFMIVESSKNLDCFDLARTCRKFQKKVHGIKIAVHDTKENKILIICGIVDDMVISCINEPYILSKFSSLYKEIPKDPEFEIEEFKRFIESLTVKDLLIYKNKDLYQRFMGYISQINQIKKKPISQNVNEFINGNLFSQRKMLMLLLIKYKDPEFQYMAYLLYDLLSNESTDKLKYDTIEQTLLFDSFPWTIKKYFREAMHSTIKYTNNLSNFDSNRIPEEQQICLLKAPDKVKEKAMIKLKEVKAKSEDSGSKARQYLDGLLKIPFGVYRSEPILSNMKNVHAIFLEIMKIIVDKNIKTTIPDKKKYSSLEISKYCSSLLEDTIPLLKEKTYCKIIKLFCTGKRDTLISNVCYINGITKKSGIKHKICHSGKKNSYMKEKITDFIAKNKKNQKLIINLKKRFNKELQLNETKIIEDKLKKITKEWEVVSSSIKNIHNTLDKAVYGHKKAKRQIERIIGEWMNGEQTGYAFGFEGPPGTGKCHRIGTPIMLSNGKIKKVENIKIGDKIMGDDSTPRNIMALGRGREKMYEIKPVKGDSYTVNESHILSLKMTKASRKGRHQLINGKRYWKDDIVDICIKDYLSLPKSQKACLKGYKVGVEFPKKKVDLDPYVLGYWLGDGTSSAPQITTEDEPVVEYFRCYCDQNHILLKVVGDTKITYRMTSGIRGGVMTDNRNPILDMLKKYKVLNNKHIPHVYKCNSRDIQLELLAGIIDSDGSLNNSGYDIIQKNEKLMDDIIFLARSLGFAAYKKECQKSCMYKGEKRTSTYYRTQIHGEGLEYIPVKLERKKANKRKQIKNVLNTGIKVIPLEEDEYYGFEIDGNSRFLMGDFTVTHNTSMAKLGIASCLKGNDNNFRPFAFIAVGGSSNGSTLQGHNYTYVGSTWGRIVDILIETKCMNPIIFIDELDKVSKSEHGKEIIGILTHLIDQTQNDSFQDKYFSGVDLDLSKALFIFSYNDANLIDRILLDRIHRVKFDILSIDDKIIITNSYLLPELYKKIGLVNTIKFPDKVIKYIIENYTYEAGVRKLKETLTEVIREINLEILNNERSMTEIPIVLTIDDIYNKYLKDRVEVSHNKIHKKSTVGIINGLWANSLGKGGIISIEACWYLANNPLNFKLTGLQGDVMKESMEVAKTLAWKLSTKKTHDKFIKQWEKTRMQGIHIHCPEGSVPKDGPSAGTAITIVIYSLINKKAIKNNIAITGEMDLQGNVSKIGGLQLKILGGIRAGVTEFIFPKDNKKDFDKFIKQYGKKPELNNIKFYPVSCIEQVLKLVFV